MIEITSRNGEWNNHDWYLLSRHQGTEYLFYVPTLRRALLLSETLGRSISSKGALPEAIAARISENSLAPVSPVAEGAKGFHLALGLTNNCNLACDYCHAEADKETIFNSDLTAYSIDYAFDKAARTPNKTLNVSFAVGGEPTLNWSAFTYTVTRIRELEKNHGGVDSVYLSMTTNCFYGEEKRQFCASNFDALTLSIDGYEEIQDRHRPTRASKGSYSLVSETCKYYLHNSKVKASLRGTVSDYSVTHLADIVEHYFNVFGSGYTVAFEPLIRIGRALSGHLSPPSNEDFARNFWSARERGKRFGIRVITSAANIDRLVARYCGAMSAPSFAVCTNGKITACHRDQDGTDYAYGKIDAETRTVSINESEIERNASITRMPPTCYGCFAKWHCAGDCPDIRRIGYSRCDINRFIVFNELYELLTRGGGSNQVSSSSTCVP